MSRQIIIRDEALFDVIDAAYYLAQSSLEVSDRFVEAVDAAYRSLAETPGIGTLRAYNNPKLAGLRMWRVPNFRNYLIFYLATEASLEIVRVLHGAQNIEQIFSADEDE